MPQTAVKHAHHRARKLVKDTWKAQANLSFFLGLMVLFVFVLPLSSLVEKHFSLYVDIGYSLMLISGIAIGWGMSWLFYLGAAAGVVGLMVRWLGWWYPDVSRFREPTTLVAIIFLILLLLVRVFRKGPVSGSRLQGAVAVYLLMGILWAHAYLIFSRDHPNSFATNENVPPTVAGWTYFSFVTLTTVGYGDITPKAPAARMLAVGEALAGQMYLAVMLARLVALQVTGGTDNGTAAEKSE
ncbi:MAG: potassium channel family protein [Candidatus Korobacteraceae bacterium]